VSCIAAGPETVSARVAHLYREGRPIVRPHISLSLVRIALIVLCFASAGPGISAQTRDEPRLDRILSPGMTVWITDSTGREEETRIVGLSGDTVRTATGGGTRLFRTTEIVRARVRKTDSVVNGALIGAGVAVASGLFLCRLTEPWEICGNAGPLLQIGAVGAGAGAGIDALIRGRMTIYEAAPGKTRVRLMPALALRSAGLQLSLSF
jgi:hypothetical protein